MHIQSNITKHKFNHLESYHYQFIESEYNHFISSGRKRKNNFIRNLAHAVGTSLSNLYTVIYDITISLLSTDWTIRNAFNASTTYKKRVTNFLNNSSKLEKAESFIEDVVTRFKCDSTLDSINEIIKHKSYLRNTNMYAQIQPQPSITISTIRTFLLNQFIVRWLLWERENRLKE